MTMYLLAAIFFLSIVAGVMCVIVVVVLNVRKGMMDGTADLAELESTQLQDQLQLPDAGGVPELGQDKLDELLRREVSQGNTPSVLLLLETGADPYRKDANGFTPLVNAQMMESERPGRCKEIIEAMKRSRRGTDSDAGA